MYQVYAHIYRWFRMGSERALSSSATQEVRGAVFSTIVSLLQPLGVTFRTLTVCLSPSGLRKMHWRIQVGGGGWCRTFEGHYRTVSRGGLQPLPQKSTVCWMMLPIPTCRDLALLSSDRSPNQQEHELQLASPSWPCNIIALASQPQPNGSPAAGAPPGHGSSQPQPPPSRLRSVPYFYRAMSDRHRASRWINY